MPLHISYFLQNRKKANSFKTNLLLLESEITDILRSQKLVIIADICNLSYSRYVGAKRNEILFFYYYWSVIPYFTDLYFCECQA